MIARWHVNAVAKQFGRRKVKYLLSMVIFRPVATSYGLSGLDLRSSITHLLYVLLATSSSRHGFVNQYLQR